MLHALVYVVLPASVLGQLAAAICPFLPYHRAAVIAAQLDGINPVQHGETFFTAFLSALHRGVRALGGGAAFLAPLSFCVAFGFAILFLLATDQDHDGVIDFTDLFYLIKVVHQFGAMFECRLFISDPLFFSRSLIRT